MSLPGIQGVIGSVTAGTSILNAFLVILQRVNFDVKGSDDVAFLFAYREEDILDLRSDITDHYSESNSALQDQIALKPIEMTIHGFIGELGDQKTGLAEQVRIISTQLGVLAPYLPELTIAAQTAYNQAEQIYNAAASAAAKIDQLFDFSGTGRQTKQQKALGYFRKHWEDRDLFTLQTPWSVLEDMAISSLHVVQDAESTSISDFRITFKQMKFATTLSSDASIAQGRRSAQAAPAGPSGSSNGTNLGPAAFNGTDNTTATKG